MPTGVGEQREARTIWSCGRKVPSSPSRVFCGKEREVDKSPVERLETAGLCKSGDLSQKDKAALNSLSDQEVQYFIDLHTKLGRADSDAARPFIPI